MAVLTPARAALLTAVAIFAVIAALVVGLGALDGAQAGERGCRITMSEKRAYGVEVTTWTRICRRIPSRRPPFLRNRPTAVVH